MLRNFIQEESRLYFAAKVNYIPRLSILHYVTIMFVVFAVCTVAVRKGFLSTQILWWPKIASVCGTKNPRLYIASSLQHQYFESFVIFLVFAVCVDVQKWKSSTYDPRYLYMWRRTNLARSWLWSRQLHSFKKGLKLDWLGLHILKCQLRTIDFTFQNQVMSKILEDNFCT